jgi:hypothetical protein
VTTDDAAGGSGAGVESCAEAVKAHASNTAGNAAGNSAGKFIWYEVMQLERKGGPPQTVLLIVLMCRRARKGFVTNFTER